MPTANLLLLIAVLLPPKALDVLGAVIDERTVLTPYGEAGPLAFTLNLPAFYEPDHGFDVAAFGDAVGLATLALALHAPQAERLGVGFADLAGLLALLGLDYDSAQARAVAALVREYMPHLPFSEAISSLHGDVRGLVDVL